MNFGHIIPKSLIYEFVNGRPVYCADYKHYLSGQKQIEQIKSRTYLQGLLASEIILALGSILDLKKYRIISNEIGLQFSKQSWRAADIAVFNKADLKGVPLHNKYMKIAPEVVIEIDTKADLEGFLNPLSYHHLKTEELLDFGVKKVIWIFTDTKRVMIADNRDNWQTVTWKQDIEVTDGAILNLEEIYEGLTE